MKKKIFYKIKNKLLLNSIKKTMKIKYNKCELRD